VGLSEIKDDRAKDAASAIADYIRLRELGPTTLDRAESISAAFERLVASLRGLQ